MIADKENENSPVFYIGGVKGGVGRTTLSVALADWIYARTGKVIFVDMDPQNPDGGQYFDASMPGLDIQSIGHELIAGLTRLANADPSTPVVMNSFAIKIDSALNKENGSVTNIINILKAFNRPFLHVTPVDRDLSTISLLDEAISNNPELACRTAVVLNGMNGPAESFTNFNGSDTEAKIKSSSGSIFFMPKIHGRYVRMMRQKMVPMRRLLDDMSLSLGDRIFLKADQKRWDRLFEALWWKTIS
jgi:hypothetical protein